MRGLNLKSAINEAYMFPTNFYLGFFVLVASLLAIEHIVPDPTLAPALIIFSIMVFVVIHASKTWRLFLESQSNSTIHTRAFRAEVRKLRGCSLVNANHAYVLVLFTVLCNFRHPYDALAMLLVYVVSSVIYRILVKRCFKRPRKANNQ